MSVLSDIGFERYRFSYDPDLFELFTRIDHRLVVAVLGNEHQL